MKHKRGATLRILLAAVLGVTVSLPAHGKPRGCFTAAEHNAERVVRHGIFLRAMAVRCDGVPFSMGTVAVWADLETRLGPQFKRLTDLRQRGFEREFEKRAQQILFAWDGRLVMQNRHMFLTKPQCDDAKKQMEEGTKRGFAAIRKQADKMRNEVYGDYKICD